jgi:hypothetical protein
MSLFKKVLWHFFDPYERVEADDGYHAGHMDKVKFPTNTANLVERQAMQGRVRARQKTLHGWLKNWGVLSPLPRLLPPHLPARQYIPACTVVTQLTIENKD